jgi:hypothetical protein
VGVFRGRGIDSARWFREAGGPARNPNWFRGLFSGFGRLCISNTDRIEAVYSRNPPERRVLSEPFTTSARGALFGQLTWTGLHASDRPDDTLEWIRGRKRVYQY